MIAQEGPRWGCMLPEMEAAGSAGRQAGQIWAGAEAAAALVVDHGHAQMLMPPLPYPELGSSGGLLPADSRP